MVSTAPSLITLISGSWCFSLFTFPFRVGNTSGHIVPQHGDVLAGYALCPPLIPFFSSSLEAKHTLILCILSLLYYIYIIDDTS